MKIGIIGATGWLGSALGSRLLSQGVVAPADLAVLNRSGPRDDYFGHRGVIWARDVADLVARSDVIVVSVRPQDWPALALSAPGRLVISFMAGVPLDRIGRSGARVVRAMPNAAAETGNSYSPWFAGPGVTDADKQTVTRVLSAIGTSDELTGEKQIDLMTALPGSGSAYPALMAVAMTEYMRGYGVPDHVAFKAVEAAVVDGAAMLAGRIDKAPEMVAAYVDYQGTTAAGIATAEASGFSAAIRAALDAAADKARALGQDGPAENGPAGYGDGPAQDGRA
ncbi:pyrroline-5-carboxylate reductase dimerization domain-containing protein [Paracoccus sp. DMF-8]|uniref:pyrroline-5-carboxylate reductase family protein n=1 Tax=Paracoccus sp. DMF-8 TaxID=3019445 RepID=UPI0023E3F465|nr:pyrroline-5-carboxylate reductase dimerization domain-containing protein [Paracoccus sp. DMF-8]MDF3607650.1 pyrroline-5-carboxylate reductase dimerization domain-containing protein [Paracoccus sp. DMF-8]